jgi:hypothetical protein
MNSTVEERIQQLSRNPTQVRWCDQRRFAEENAPEVAPGGYLNRFGWLVVGTTIGGNAIVVREDEPGVYFADHTSYSDDEVSYPSRSGRGWTYESLTSESVRRSLVSLADSDEEFVHRADSGEVDERIDALD